MGIAQEVRGFIVENFLFGDTEVPLGEDDSFLQKGLIDSTGILEVVSFLEDKYEIAVEDDELVPENLDSIQAIANFVMRKKEIRV